MKAFHQGKIGAEDPEFQAILVSCSITKSQKKWGKSKLLGMHESWLSNRSFWENIFNKNLLSWTLLSARRRDAQRSLSTTQSRRSRKAWFARGRLKVLVRSDLTWCTVTKRGPRSIQAIPGRSELRTLGKVRAVCLNCCSFWGKVSPF